MSPMLFFSIERAALMPADAITACRVFRQRGCCHVAAADGAMLQRRLDIFFSFFMPRHARDAADGLRAPLHDMLFRRCTAR